MQKLPQPFQKPVPNSTTPQRSLQRSSGGACRAVAPANFQSDELLSVVLLEHQAREWLYDCEYRQHSKGTIANRRLYLDKLLWFLRANDCEFCGVQELRRFFAYLTNGHETNGGRWNGAGSCHAAGKPLRPTTIATYHRHLRAFFNWCVGEGLIEDSPMQRIAAPVARADQVQPFTLDQVRALIHASRRTRNAERDEAIVRLLLDTGMRASELCGLRMEQLDLFGHRATILGKGNKHRAVHFGAKTARALRSYLRFEERTPADAVFQTAKNQHAGQPMRAGGLLQVIEHLGKLAGVQAVRCSPHTLRHTFAVEFLRNGGNVFSLKEILGHTSLHMTNRYVALAQADIEQQQRRYAPGDRLGM
jgi:site-specific recombinase XerD